VVVVVVAVAVAVAMAVVVVVEGGGGDRWKQSGGEGSMMMMSTGLSLLMTSLLIAVIKLWNFEIKSTGSLQSIFTHAFVLTKSVHHSCH
jgi:preprotein translocase subunit SecG